MNVYHLLGILLIVPFLFVNPLVIIVIILIAGVIEHFSFKPISSSKVKKKYLKSPEWDRMRNKILYRDGYQCQSCFSKPKHLEVHHITYERLGKENTEDLVTLCRDCHQAIHDRLGYSYKTIYKVH